MWAGVYPADVPLADYSGVWEFSELGAVFSELANLTGPDNKYVHYTKLAAFRIESDEPLQMNLDGEPLRDTAFDFRVLHRALRFVLPPDAPLNR